MRLLIETGGVFSGVRDIKSREAAHAARRVFILRGEGVSGEEQGAVAVHAADVQGVRAHAARSYICAKQRALARAARGAAARAGRRGRLAHRRRRRRCRRHRHRLRLRLRRCRRASGARARRLRRASEGNARRLTTACT